MCVPKSLALYFYYYSDDEYVPGSFMYGGIPRYALVASLYSLRPINSSACFIDADVACFHHVIDAYPAVCTVYVSYLCAIPSVFLLACFSHL